MRAKRLISLITIAAILLLAPIHAAAATRYSDGVYTFEKTESGTARFVECNLTESKIEVPGQVLGYSVTEIGGYAFAEYGGVTDIALPETVVSIGEYAFAENPGLQYVTILRKCESIAGNAFLNTPDVTIRCYYDSAAYLFAKEKGIAVKLLDNALLGDVNADNHISISDVTAIQQHLAGLKSLNGICLMTSDIDADNDVDVTDATAIQRFLAKFEEPYSIGKKI